MDWNDYENQVQYSTVGTNNSIECPNCHDPYLHQTDVVVRDSDGISLSIQWKHSRFLPKPRPYDPSPAQDRGCTGVRFWCEICHGETFLVMSNYKGYMNLYWGPTQLYRCKGGDDPCPVEGCNEDRRIASK